MYARDSSASSSISSGPAVFPAMNRTKFSISFVFRDRIRSRDGVSILSAQSR